MKHVVSILVVCCAMLAAGGTKGEEEDRHTGSEVEELIQRLLQEGKDMIDIIRLREKQDQRNGLIAWCEVIPEPERGHIVQVGVWIGEATQIFAQHFRTVTDVDSWKGLEDVYKQYRHYCGNIFNVYHIRRPSIEAAKQFQHESISAVYIDASRDQQSVEDDINAWYPIVAPGGYIGGHDYCGAWPGVEAAIKKTLPQYTPVIFEDTSWLIKKA